MPDPVVMSEEGDISKPVLPALKNSEEKVFRLYLPYLQK